MEKVNRIIQEVSKAFMGDQKVIEKIFMTILSKGHVLLEDIPGVGKTTLAKAFGKVMDLSMCRMQFTVDVLPSDVVGYKYMNIETGEEKMHLGAIFTNMFLADELNRTSSKTQGALLEAMEEGTVTIEGTTLPIEDIFFVVATQNPYGSAGTQLLPESQRDRFMVRLSLGYPSFDDELEILKRKNVKEVYDLQKIINKEELIEMQNACEKIFVHEDIYKYIVSLVQATRNQEDIQQGASPRASIGLCNMAKANAFIHGRDYVIASDVADVFYDVLGHRIILKSGKEDVQSINICLKKVFDRTPSPKLGDLQ